MSGPTPKTRRAVLARDAETCQWCGGTLANGWFYSLQHRRARGMGGSRVPWVNLPGNLVAVHGSGTTGCHGHIEANPKEAAARGFRLSHRETPEDLPLIDYAGVAWILRDDGTRERKG